LKSRFESIDTGQTQALRKKTNVETTYQQLPHLLINITLWEKDKVY